MDVSRAGQRVAEGLARRWPGAWHDLRRRLRPERFPPELSLVAALCDPRRRAVDVGGETGVWTREMARHAAGVTIFQPDRALWPGLRRIAGRDARLEAVVLSAHLGRAEYRSVGPEAVPSLPVVDLRPLDAFDLGEVCLMRLDVGAAALDVLAGAPRLLAASRPALLIEAGSRDGERSPGLVRALHRYGYVAVRIDRGELVNVGPEERSAGTLIGLPSEGTELRTKLERTAQALRVDSRYPSPSAGSSG